MYNLSQRAAFAVVIREVRRNRLQFKVVNRVVAFVFVLVMNNFVRSRDDALVLPVHRVVLVAVFPAVPLARITFRALHKLVRTILHW